MTEIDRTAVELPLQRQSIFEAQITATASAAAADLGSQASQARAEETTAPIANRHISNDLRVLMVVFVEKHSLSLSCLFTCILIVMTIYSIVREYQNSCDQNIKLWLSGTALRALLVTIVKLFAEAVTRQYISYSGNPQLFQKIVEMLDVFGIVWFCIGNLLVFNDSGCKKETPFVFYTSLIYILVVYFIFISSIVIRVSLAACPASVDLRSLLDSLHEASLVATTETMNWTAWLESYGCKEMPYAVWRQLQNKEISSLSESADQRESVGIVQINALHADLSLSQTEELDRQLTSSCPICLCDFDDNSQSLEDLENQAIEGSSSRNSASQVDTVVSFPCLARHIFHSHCLHRWLAVAGSRRQTAITCPVCRDHAPDSTVNPYRRFAMATNRLSVRQLSS